MILRRVRNHVVEHNWFAVAIDFVIVVVGVFLGIEVSNWNEARQERSDEHRYYQQIREDLVADLDILTTAKRHSLGNDREAEVVLGAIEEGPPPGQPPGKVAVAIHRAGYLYLPVASRRTYDELISTGNLRLLRDRELKNEIVGYYAKFQELRQWDQLMRDQQKEYWNETAGIVPRQVLQASIRGRIPDVTRSELHAMIARARSRERLPDLLMGMAAHQERVRRDSETIEKRTQDLIESLDGRIGNER